MIQKILSQTLPQAYGLQRKCIQLKMFTLTGQVSLNDRCETCTTKQKHPCDEQNIKINTGTVTITVVDYEAYIQQFNNAQLGRGKKCDFMMVDNSGNNYKVAFCELTCSQAETVESNEGRKRLQEGKRAKAMVQLEESVHRLTNKADTKNYLNGFLHRHCIFGWRDPFIGEKSVSPRRGDAEANMMSMMLTPSSAAKGLHQTKKIDGLDFDFYQVKYPDIYNW